MYLRYEIGHFNKKKPFQSYGLLIWAGLACFAKVTQFILALHDETQSGAVVFTGSLQIVNEQCVTRFPVAFLVRRTGPESVSTGQICILLSRDTGTRVLGS